MLTFQSALPEQTGIPSGCIVRFVERLERHEVPMHSLLILHRDKLITEGYYAPFTKNTLHRMFSVSKSFTSIAVALLAEEGKLAINDPVVKYFPDKVPSDVHPWISAMTIRDMLMMRTCHASTTYKPDMTKDWVESFFTTPPTHPTGRIFHYDTSASHTLCALAERLSQKPMLDYLKEKLPELGLSGESYMLKDPFGVSLGGSGLVAVPMDLMRFGYLIYHKGKVCGRQLVSSAYIEEAVSPLTDTSVTAPVLSEACGYGYQFWQNQKGGCVCYGMGGQLVILLPRYDMICVTTADTQGIGGGNQLIYDALYEEILPHISKEPVPALADDSGYYKKMLAGLQMHPLKGHDFSPMMKLIDNSVYHVCDNPMGFQKLSLTFTRQWAACFTNFPYVKKNSGSAVTAGTLHFTLKGQCYSFSFGFGYLETGTFPLYDLKYAASAIWSHESTLCIKVHIIDAYMGSVKFELAFSQKDVTVFMKKQEESLFHEFNGHLYALLSQDENL